jgi:hypothetical protein
MFMDELRDKVWSEIRQLDLRSFDTLLSEDTFIKAAEMTGVRLGCSPLSLAQMVWLGVSGAMHVTRNFASVLQLTVKILEDFSDWSPRALPRSVPQRQKGSKKKQKPSKRNPRGSSPLGVTEEAFVQARKRMPLSFWAALVLVLSQRFEKKHKAWVHWKKFRLLAVDGTTVSLAGWKKLRDHFGTAKNGKSKGRTQLRMVMLQMPMARIPWRYVVGPVAEGERTLAAKLLDRLSENDLVLLDRGFWSYGLFHQIQTQKAFFAIRLSKQIRLHTVRRLGRQDRLVRWDKPTGPRWCGLGLPNSIDLRVVEYRIPGFRPSAVVTNVLQPTVVSRMDWVRLASETEPGDERLGVGLYHRRWEIETTFRELKVTQAMEGHLRGRQPESVYYEIAGHVVLYLLVRWLIVEAAVAAGVDPLRVSFKAALEELQDMRPALITASVNRLRDVLLPRLLMRIAQHLVPLRPGRHYPRPHDTQVKNCGRGRRIQPHKLRNSASQT